MPERKKKTKIVVALIFISVFSFTALLFSNGILSIDKSLLDKEEGGDELSDWIIQGKEEGGGGLPDYIVQGKEEGGGGLPDCIIQLKEEGGGGLPDCIMV